jgi:hypothetical protein
MSVGGCVNTTPLLVSRVCSASMSSIDSANEMPSSTRASRYAQCYWVPGWPRKGHVLLAGDEVQRGEVGDQVAFQAAGVVEVELLEAFGGREPGSPDPISRWSVGCALR